MDSGSSSSSSSSYSASSTHSQSTTIEEDVQQRPAESETRGSCYFPGCRKDANCDCDMCLESIYATRDLMPSSNRSTKPKPFSVDKSCILMDSTLLSTPELKTPQFRVSTVTPCTAIRSTAKSIYPVGSEEEEEPQAEKIESPKQNCGGSRHGWLGLAKCVLLVVSLVLGLELGACWLISGMLRPQLSADVVKVIGERCSAVQDSIAKLKLVEKELAEGFSVKDGTISSCSSSEHSIWKINQDGSILNSRCTLYESASEEVSIWGWPLQSAGILAAGISNRSLTVISGRVTEWPNGRVDYLVRNASSSWTMKKLSVSPVKLHPDTWILEYRQSVFVENSSLLSAAGELLKFRISRVIGKMRQRLWVLPFLDGDCSCSSSSSSSRSMSGSRSFGFVPT